MQVTGVDSKQLFCKIKLKQRHAHSLMNRNLALGKEYISLYVGMSF